MESNNNKGEDTKNNEENTSRNSSLTWQAVILALWHSTVSFHIGFVFGFAMEKSRVSEPQSIRDQFLLKRFLMIKMFLAALMTSSLSVWSVHIIFPKLYTSIFKSFKSILVNKTMQMMISGSVLLGVGMFLSASCPGMVLVQVGSGVQNSWITVFGCLCGALLYALIYDNVSYTTEYPKPLSKALFEITSVNHNFMRLTIVLMLVLVLCFLEYFIPWSKENVKPPYLGRNVFRDKAWMPSISGVIIGFCQLPSLLFTHRSLTGTGVYMAVISQLCVFSYIRNRFPFLKRYCWNLNFFVSVSFAFGVMIGGLCSSFSSKNFGLVQGVHPLHAFLGGMLMLLGARIAGGCTSAHGISGVSHLFLGSFVATVFMFAGGILTAFVHKLE